MSLLSHLDGIFALPNVVTAGPASLESGLSRSATGSVACCVARPLAVCPRVQLALHLACQGVYKNKKIGFIYDDYATLALVTAHAPQQTSGCRLAVRQALVEVLQRVRVKSQHARAQARPQRRQSAARSARL